tara:strand:- start:666 stop:1097 length:432 start_codon:yes stop_codon:yes gene_type:complete
MVILNKSSIFVANKQHFYMKIQVSIGEVVDKYTILVIKFSKIKEVAKLDNIQKELNYIVQVLREDYSLITDDYLTKGLLEINKELWKIEDDVRDCERSKDFGPKFIQLARSVYKLNDKRAHIKKEINIKYGSEFVEEKSYQPY